MAKFETDGLIYNGSRPFSLSSIGTRTDSVYTSKKDYRSKLASMVKRIDELQATMNADNRHGILLVFQAMDAAGKDGTIRRVLTGVNPAGVQVYSFKKPSAEELDHGYLWRVIQRMPERGRIGVFNRSYYEEVLVVRVHPEILTEYQQIPQELTLDTDAVFESRFEQIRNFEEYAVSNGIKVIKFFLNVSKEEQRKRLLARLDEPQKHWKFSFSDVDEREHWDSYMQAFTDCINKTATATAPWAVIPADDKLNMRLLVTRIVLQEMEKMNLQWPPANPRLSAEIDEVRARLND
ncbi:phosphate--nucleotide phosphotransferase [Chromatiales bacterium (ex Bugula neritina AB1)]|nr:phosphate--nucleotide phosphotransferase [Chromatiales bacterium (ex Bugula neritina AB1)]